jgi:hypothetical protein
MLSDRRAARGVAEVRTAAAGPMPAELMSGPCIEDWAGRSELRPVWATSNWLAFQARRNWQDAVDSWVVESGWASEKRPAANARNLARTQLPWSRVFLLEQGRSQLVAFYEGRRATYPKSEGDRWRPREGACANPTALAKGAMT